MAGNFASGTPATLVRAGIVGTGYAAARRAEAIQADNRSQLITIAGHQPDRTTTFAQTYGVPAVQSWRDLVKRSDIDLVIICSANYEHGKIARAALEAGKHVVVEYPLALTAAEAAELIALAKQQNKLLHVEHIELLSGIHQSIKAALPGVGIPFYLRSASLMCQQPAPEKWSYHREQFGFPLVGAVSRIHRLTDLFGSVATVSCQTRFWDSAKATGYFSSCLCTAQLRFTSGLIAEVVYGKGEAIWYSDRTLTIQGDRGALTIDGEQGQLVTAEGTKTLTVGSRRGLFAKDTTQVLDHLTIGTPLYVSLNASLYALQVADAARRSAEVGEVVEVGE
ncbi:Gfo/Idh/MocA family protein [Leptolyngbya ohadii]|uniref:Gfo/Idh/MocA family protein n=1 Tax=Leptolyngbya ohadii TaxID=1962290 RepID=UPI000B59A16D|nr:Gfo/Idh/MocA family oxidoreductase [Leptolyngbya ohadii]